MVNEQTGNVPPDEELVTRILGGEPAAFGMVVRRYNQRLYRTARAIVRDELEAEDAVQAAYVHAFQHLAALKERARLGGWLITITINEALRRSRERQRTHPLEAVVVEMAMAARKPMTQAEGPEERLLGKELAGLLERGIDELPEPMRLVFVLRVVEGLETAEVAAALGISEENVRVRLHRAREALQRLVYQSTEPVAAARTFQFLGRRCDALTERVMARLGLRVRPVP